jgi:hypothetical protein
MVPSKLIATMPKQQQRAIKRGRWRYAGEIPKGVIIHAINYDYWYELEKSDGLDMTGEVPELNEQGEMYLIAWMNSAFTKQESFTVGLLTLTATMDLASSIVQQPIEWL